MNKIEFSVVIPLYNKEQEIKNTINSVLNQTYKADEIIVVNDGSTDNSLDVIQGFKGKIKIINQINQGETASRNRGIKEAKNEYMCFIDADDLWEDMFLDEIVSLIKDYPKAVFYSTSHKIIDEKGDIIYAKRPDYRGIIEDFSFTFSSYYGLLNSSSVCIKKSLDLKFPVGETKGGDLCMWLELSLKGKLAFSPKYLSVYKLDATNRSCAIHKEAVVPCPIKWFYKNKDKLILNQQYKSIKKFIYSNLFLTVYGGYGLSQNHTSISAVIKLMKKNKDKFYILLYPAYWMPIWFLNIVKNIRRALR